MVFRPAGSANPLNSLESGSDTTCAAGLPGATVVAMEQRLKLHIVGGDSRLRAEQARLAFSLGHHAEVYSDLPELIDMNPGEGVIIACDGVLASGMDRLLDRLGNAGIWLPVIAASHAPDVDDVVQAIRAGALDYLRLPLTEAEFARMVAHVITDAGRHGEARRRLVEARQRIGTLSRREREVLEWLSAGCSNKAIARALDISPRTVEIHRANMMEKLGATHSAEAVRLRLEARFEDAMEPEPVQAAQPVMQLRA
jgi:two-component system, LuxR family, response regulator FixJ